MTLSQSDYYPWTCYIFFVNKKKTKDVGELRQWTVEEWKQLGQHMTDNVIRHAGDCEAVWMQMVDSYILCD